MDPCQVPSITRPGTSLLDAVRRTNPTCAVVSSSGVLNMVAEGRRIDHADIVVTSVALHVMSKDL
eukprot:1809328-Amphidinium_carterae.1